MKVSLKNHFKELQICLNTSWFFSSIVSSNPTQDVWFLFLSAYYYFFRQNSFNRPVSSLAVLFFFLLRVPLSSDHSSLDHFLLSVSPSPTSVTSRSTAFTYEISIFLSSWSFSYYLLMKVSLWVICCAGCFQTVPCIHITSSRFDLNTSLITIYYKTTLFLYHNGNRSLVLSQLIDGSRHFFDHEQHLRWWFRIPHSILQHTMEYFNFFFHRLPLSPFDVTVFVLCRQTSATFTRDQFLSSVVFSPTPTLSMSRYTSFTHGAFAFFLLVQCSI